MRGGSQSNGQLAQGLNIFELFDKRPARPPGLGANVEVGGDARALNFHVEDALPRLERIRLGEVEPDGVSAGVRSGVQADCDLAGPLDARGSNPTRLARDRGRVVTE